MNSSKQCANKAYFFYLGNFSLQENKELDGAKSPPMPSFDVKAGNETYYHNPLPFIRPLREFLLNLALIWILFECSSFLSREWLIMEFSVLGRFSFY